MSTLDPEEAAAIGNPEIGEIAPTTRMGPVSLAVADLEPVGRLLRRPDRP